MDRLTARRYIIVRRFVGRTRDQPEKRRNVRRRREEKKSNRDWIYGDRVQPVVFFLPLYIIFTR